MLFVINKSFYFHSAVLMMLVLLYLYAAGPREISATQEWRRRRPDHRPRPPGYALP